VCEKRVKPNPQSPIPNIRYWLSALLLGVALVVLAFSSGFVVAALQAQSALPLRQDAPLSGGPLHVFQEAWDLITRDFYGALPVNDARVYGAVRGLLGTLNDPYTVFVEPTPHQLEQDNLRGSYGGVGVTLERDAAGQAVMTPWRDSPAAQAGILQGDVLLAVDGVSITPEMDLSADVVPLIRGQVGTQVTLSVQRAGETLTFTLTRQVIELPSVEWRMLEQAPTLGYVQISSFTDRTADELQQALAELFASDAAGLILDLRNNGGGLLQASIDVADQFLAEGAILYENRRASEEKLYPATPEGQAQHISLVVLINHGTASAAEIVAGAIQDHRRGQLVGETTFGKGSVQLIFDLSDGSSLHVTAARWYTPGRRQLDGAGLTPDVQVEANPDTANDVQLERAITLLQTGR